MVKPPEESVRELIAKGLSRKESDIRAYQVWILGAALIEVADAVRALAAVSESQKK